MEMAILIDNISILIFHSPLISREKDGSAVGVYSGLAEEPGILPQPSSVGEP